MKEELSSPHFTEDETEAQVEVKSSRSPNWDVAELRLEPGLRGSLSHDQGGLLPHRWEPGVQSKARPPVRTLSLDTPSQEVGGWQVPGRTQLVGVKGRSGHWPQSLTVPCKGTMAKCPGRLFWAQGVM